MVVKVESTYGFELWTASSRDDRSRITVYEAVIISAWPSKATLVQLWRVGSPHVFDLGQNPRRRLAMRLSGHSFVHLLSLSLVALAGARPIANGLVVRQDTNSPPPGTNSSPPQSSPSPTDRPSSSSQVSTPASSSTPSSGSSLSSSTSFGLTSQATVISSIPSVTLQRESSTSSYPTETEAPVPNTPAGFFSNRNATILLGGSVGAVVGLVLLVTLWINFRRSWYFPWNKKKQRNDPSRWSRYSFREKPQFPLGRAQPPTASTESFAKPEAPSNDGHDSHGHMHELDYHIPPLPEIRIDSPKSAYNEGRPFEFRRPPGLERFGRSSGMISQYTVDSIYSQPTDADTPEPSIAGGGLRSLRRVTSSSSDNSPFRFDPPAQTRNTPLLRAARSDEGHGVHTYDAADRDTWVRDSLDPVEATLRALSGNHRPGHTKEVSHFSIDEEDEREYNHVQRSMPSIGWKDTAASYGMVQPPSKNIGSTLLTPKSPTTPKSILKTPHYQTTSTRLAQTRQPSRI